MKRIVFAWVFVSALSAMAPGLAHAQGFADYGKGIRFDFDDSGNKYFRLITWHQVWTRFTQYNPGTTVQGNNESSGLDIGLRRSRFLGYGQLTKDLLILMHFGINNQTFNGARKPGIFVHGAWLEYQLVEEKLFVGTGLHYWNGISRMTNASTLNFLAVDATIFNWPTVDKTDQFARMLGVYAKGNVGPLHYRLALNRPFSTTETPRLGRASYNPQANTFASAGYLTWMFFDRESTKLPYFVGTYLGTKRVLNVGAGWLYHPRAMASLRGAASEVQKWDMTLVGADLFYDSPLGPDGSALTAYLVYQYYDMGPNYLRYVGIMNIGAGGSTLNGAGNAYPLLGTGHTVYGQVGYLVMPETLGIKLQPYAAATVGIFEALDDPSFVFEGGLNWYIAGHHAKVTLHYRLRPIFVTDGDQSVRGEFKSELIAQTQIYF